MLQLLLLDTVTVLFNHSSRPSKAKIDRRPSKERRSVMLKYIMLKKLLMTKTREHDGRRDLLVSGYLARPSVEPVFPVD